MLDDKQPYDSFSGKDDMYRLLRETRTAINLLMVRVEAIEGILKDDNRNNFIDEGDAEDIMANTKGNGGMVPKVYGRKGGFGGGKKK